MTRYLAVPLSLLLLLPALSRSAAKPENGSALVLSTDSVAPNRFVAAHGRRSVIMGYPHDGLEIWAYPFQILNHYQVSFRPSSATTATDGRLLLRRLDYRPDSITRLYIGPDYLVREKLFVPLNQPAAIITYEVEGIRPLEIEISFQPVLNLMWPAALGGQYTRWTDAGSGASEMPGFVISEPGQGFSAAFGSRQAVRHSDTVNSTVIPENGLSLSLEPAPEGNHGPATATLYLALNPAGTKNLVASLLALSTQKVQLEQEAAAHYAELERTALRIRTPDPDVNRSLAFAAVALDQAWVCNPSLGCGLVAGYGPSRDARRPQYDWFFGGDGLVATNALVSAGEYSRAREELRFIQRYQDKSSGMIWHELSQSAGFIDWSKYPYMFVHVDISFDYLTTLARYVRVSGDIDFVRQQWASVMAAYRYCQSQINPGDHLPHIPPDKEAGDEQHRPADDLGLAASWFSAQSGFADLAQLTGHPDQAQEARRQLELTRQSIPAHYWNADKNFWFDGHTESGEPIFRYAAGPTHLLVQPVFSPQQSESILDQLTSSNFQTDWGSRGVASTAKDYNPYSYGAGSVSALGTAEIARTFWLAHRPECALGLWSGIQQWNHLDSLGHIHEVLAGNFFHEETESVPEQIWSSAGFLDASVRGLFGLTVDGVLNQVQFAPHLPPDWNQVSIENVRMPGSNLAFELHRSFDATVLKIRNEGAATHLDFQPQIPTGAALVESTFRGAKIASSVQNFPGDTHAGVKLTVPPGSSELHLQFHGGFVMTTVHPDLQIGDPSSQLKIIKLRFLDHQLTIDAEIHPAGDHQLKLETPWRMKTHTGLTVSPTETGVYQLDLKLRSGSPPPLTSSGYSRVQATITFDY